MLRAMAMATVLGGWLLAGLDSQHAQGEAAKRTRIRGRTARAARNHYVAPPMDAKATADDSCLEEPSNTVNATRSTISEHPSEVEVWPQAAALFPADDMDSAAN
jgi:hypothetical protein